MALDAAQFAGVVAQWVAAESGADTDALAHLLGGDFRGDDPLGFVLTKEQWLDRHRTGEFANARFAWRITEITLGNGVAVASGIQTQAATYRGVDCSGMFSAALVAVKDGDGWSIVNVQLSRTEAHAGQQSPPTRRRSP